MISRRVVRLFWFNRHSKALLLLAICSMLFQAMPLTATELRQTSNQANNSEHLTQALNLSHIPAGSLGKHVQIYTESGNPLLLSQLISAFENHEFSEVQENVINRGIGSSPVWIHLRLFNPEQKNRLLHLHAGTTWLDKLDVYLVQNGQTILHQQSGDELIHPSGLTPNQGFEIPLAFPPGITDLYLRAQSADPLVLPVELLSEAQSIKRSANFNIIYGFLYGFLIALIAYNAMLYAGLKDHRYLLYSVYLSSLILLNLAYTGQGLKWIWGDYPAIQRYIIFVLMLTFMICGFQFANVFLHLKRYTPVLWRNAKIFQAVSVASLLLAILINSQLMADITAFVSMFIFTLWIVWFAILSVIEKRIAGRYFLGAVLCSMLGTSTTTLAVSGKIPFNTWTYHALEAGIILEAILLALALASHMRQQQQARLQAENLASLKQQELQDSSQHMAAIVDNAPVAIMILDANGKITSCNRAAEIIFRVSSIDLSRRSLNSWIEFSDFNSLFNAVGTQEYMAIRSNDEKFPCDISTAAFHSSKQELHVIILRDISERKQVEKEKNEFISTVSHELRTPLTAIRGSLGLLRGGVAGGLPQIGTTMLDMAHKNTETLSHLINDLLDIQEMDIGQIKLQLQAVDLKPILHDAIQTNLTIARQMDVIVILEEPIPDIRIVVDTTRFLQIMQNILSNACKFSPAHSQIKLSAHESTPGKVTITVEDHGQGIPAQFHNKMFQRFAQADSSDTRKIGGTGLGLAIARELVTLMQGEISFQSTQGQGTTFILSFPSEKSA